ncbi:MAG: hypothetical protein RMK57_01055 [Bryobacterales bacterium]|nr:hypothetical protein [Bryobacteraceae bacterium]MDW8353092.1 hypothetical protein [Bryobacterales bacterium]
MPFTVEEFHDLVRLLEQHPEWRAELRRLVLSEELLSLPDLVKDLVQAQRRGDERFQALDARLEALSLKLEQLAEAQRRTEERLQALELRLEQLAAAQQRTEERIRELVEVQQRTQAEIVLLQRVQSDAVTRLERTEQRLADLLGRDLERRYRERAASYFQGLLRRIRVIDHQTLGSQLDDAVDAGRITRSERDEVLRLDLVVQGRLDDQEAYLAVEVSSAVDDFDVRRAAERAALLSKATGQLVIPAVAGSEVAAEVAEAAARHNVRCFLDGRPIGPP